MPKVRSQRPRIKYYIGIDIGKEGAIVVQNNLNKDIAVYITPNIGNAANKVLDETALVEILETYLNKDCHTVYEWLNPLFKSSSKATWGLAEYYFTTRGIVAALRLPYTRVNPKVWQKEMFAGIREIRKPSSTGKTQVIDTKAMALIAAKRLFPNFPYKTYSNRNGKVHDGIIDALLISEYAKRNFK